jgi:hypothetical protein
MPTITVINIARTDGGQFVIFPDPDYPSGITYRDVVCRYRAEGAGRIKLAGLVTAFPSLKEAMNYLAKTFRPEYKLRRMN